MATSFKRSLAGTSALSAPKPAASYCKPHFCQRLLDTHGQVWVSLLWDHCSWVKSLSPGSWGAQGSICALQSLFLQSCVSSGSSVVGLMATSSKRAYAIPRSTAPRALPLQQPTADLNLHRKHSSTVLSQTLRGLRFLVHTRFF